jgi:tripartite ATP-independent transporter DctP family solute receptor
MRANDSKDGEMWTLFQKNMNREDFLVKKFFLVLLVIFLSVSLVMIGCNKQAGEQKKEEVKPVEYKMSVTTADTSTWTLGAKKFAELVKERSGGKIEIKVFPNEQLSGGNQAKGIEMLQTGATDFSLHSNIIYSVIDQKFGVISLPWLMPDEATVDAKLSGAAGKKFNEMLREKGVEGLAFGENGFRQLTNSKREVKTPADIAGLKIRIPGIKMYTSLYKALGADPTAMNFAEVFTALQQGTIDGQENPTDVITSSKLYEVQKYISLWNYSYDALILGMNKAKFDALDKATQDMLRKAAEEAMVYQRKINRDKVAEQVQLFKDKGLKVTTLTPDEIKAFQEKVKPVYAEYEPIIGKDVIDLFR